MMKPFIRFQFLFIGFVCTILLSCSRNHTWHSVGPYKQSQFWSNNLDCAGEIDAMAFSENYDGEATSAMYIAGPGSGVWRSTNFMSKDPVWVPLTDHITIYSKLDPETDRRIHQDINNISTIAVDPSFPRRIYAGTVSSYSVILRSDDGGKNWSIIDAKAFGNKVGVSKIVVDPTGILYVAGAGGIWKQDSPAGNTFTNIALKANPPFHDVEYHDMVFSSNGIGQPISLYVAVIDRITPQHPQSGIWLFENGSWSKMNMELFNLQSLPFQYEDINRIKLYASPFGQVVAAMTSDNAKLRNLNGALLNVFRLERKEFHSPSWIWKPKWFSSSVIFNTRPDANDMGICIDHQGIIYCGGDRLGQSDGQGSVVVCKPAGFTRDIHPTEHAVVEYKNQIYVATDGGLFRFTNNDSPEPGKHIYESLNTKSLTNFLSTCATRETFGGDLFTGNQDNGIAAFKYNAFGEVHFSREREFIRFPPFNTGDKNTSLGYSFSPGYGFYKSTDGGFSFKKLVVPVTLNNGLYCFHPYEKGRMMINVTINQDPESKIFWNSIYETRDNWLSQPKDLANQLLVTDGSATALCYAEDIILVGAAGKIYLSPDDGTTWKNVWSNDARIMAIRFDPGNPNEIYFVTDYAFRLGSVYHGTIKNDAMEGWILTVESLNGNLNGEVDNLAILSGGPGTAPYLYVTLNNTRTNWGRGGPGVYEARDLNGPYINWTRFGTGLPDAKIYDIQLIEKKYNAGVLLVALWGRGAWQSNTIYHQ